MGLKDRKKAKETVKTETENSVSTNNEKQETMSKQETVNTQAEEKAAKKVPQFGTDLETVSSKDGRVVILENEGEFAEGVFIGSGRNIPHGEGKEIETVALVTTEGEIEKIILPMHTALASSIEEVINKGADSDTGNVFIRIVYLGKKKSSTTGQTFHSYKVAARLSTFEEQSKAGKFLTIG